MSPHSYIQDARLVTLDRVSAPSEVRGSHVVSDEGIDRPVIGASNARPLVSATNPKELVTARPASVCDASPIVSADHASRIVDASPIVSADRASRIISASPIVDASPFSGASASKGPYVVYTNGVHVIAHDRVTRSHWAVIVGDRRVLVARGMREVDERSFFGHASCRTCGRTRPAKDFAHDEKLQGPVGLGEVVR